MEKQEFLAVLQQSLSGEIPDYEVENNIRYYDGYLTDEAGKSAEDKIKELGEPRLIAKTIIDAYMANHEGNSYRTEHFSRNYDEGDDEQEAGRDMGSQHTVKYYSWNTMKWYQKLLTIVICIIVVVVLIGLVTLGINIFFSFVLPVLLILFAIKMIRNLFR